MMYRQARHTGDDMACWALSAQIEELELEISAAHGVVNGKMTAVQGSHQVVQFQNVIAPIIPQWAGREQVDLG